MPNIVRLLPAARVAGVHIVHCLVQRRPDGLGSNHNAKIFAIGRGDVDITPGTPGATLLPELGPEPTDLVLSRWHGVGPMGGTDLDAVLRNLGVSTIVVVGVSLNIAIPNLVMDAVNAAYRVVVPRDAVAGIPTDYGAAVIANTLSLLATITTTDEPAGHLWKHMTETAPEIRGGFPEVRPVETRPPELGQFVSAMHRLQDLTVSTDRTGSLWAAAAEHVSTLRATGRPSGSGDRGIAGRVLESARVGPSTAAAVDPDRRRSRRRQDGRALHPTHVGGNNAVHGGMIPLLYDWLFGMVVSSAEIHRPAPPTSMSTTATSPRSTNR